MKVEDVLKDTDKAVPVYQDKNRFSNVYASLDENGALWWHNMDSDKRLEPVPLNKINGREWCAYHEVKEIKPEKAGELWAAGSVNYMTQKIGDELRMIPRSYDMEVLIEIDHFIHGMGYYKRLFPPVENENIERIEIEGAENFRLCGQTDNQIIYKVNLPGGFVDSIENKPPMKMILEIPKDKP